MEMVPFYFNISERFDNDAFTFLKSNCLVMVYCSIYLLMCCLEFWMYINLIDITICTVCNRFYHQDYEIEMRRFALILA